MKRITHSSYKRGPAATRRPVDSTSLAPTLYAKVDVAAAAATTAACGDKRHILRCRLALRRVR